MLQRPFEKVMAANRGEIAIRIFRACYDLDIRTLAIYSKEDTMNLFRTKADEAYLIGEHLSPLGAYLAIDEIIALAKKRGVDAIHPGYGFLSENAAFAKACEDAGIKFIGPPSSVLAKMGDKLEAKKIAVACGVPVIPGTREPLKDADEALAKAKEFGFPVILKAAAGGGGRGIRRCDNAQILPAAYAEAKAEAKACFGDDEMYLEKLVLAPRHIEFQVLADRHGNVIHLGDRDCSVQRRNQKLIEEAPARCLTPALREEMGQAAVRAARAVNYEGAGTVEFLLDADGEHFYFMEMNTRIQVEHGVTEMITGVDLVRQQLRIASGLALDVAQEDIHLEGHSIECRINAEDPTKNFQPCPGQVSFLHFPGGAGVRVDSCLYNGCTLSPYYDSMAAKLLVHAPTRLEAIRKMRRCLEEFTLEGFPTNAELSYQILYHPIFVRGGCTTAFLDEHLPELLDFSRRVEEHEEGV